LGSVFGPILTGSNKMACLASMRGSCPVGTDPGIGSQPSCPPPRLPCPPLCRID
jgi:hypothetical protein